MNKTKWMATALSVFLVTIGSAVATQATSLRTFVSSTGTDTGGCLQAAPCRTFNFAFSQTTAGGEIIALDTAGYGGLTSIDKAVTIEAVPGAYAKILVQPTTTGITISAGASDVVVLRNLQITGAGASSTSGIIFITGKALVVENCTFTGLTASGLGASSGVISVKDSSFNANGIAITFSQTSKGEVVNTEVRHSNTDGLFVNSGGKATVLHSKFIGNTSRGVYATGATSEIYLLEVIVAYNGVGLKGDNTAGGGGGGAGNDGGKVFVDRSSITNNTKGAEGIASSFAVLSLTGPGGKLNTIEGNGTVNDLATITGGSGYLGK